MVPGSSTVNRGLGEFIERRQRDASFSTANPASLPDANDPSWMSVNQAAGVLGVSQDTVRRWAREGSLDANQVMPQAPWRIHVTKTR